MINVLISACLTGEKCKYNGGDNLMNDVEFLKDKINFIPVCPEVDGGLETPREPSEIKNGRVVSKCGQDVTQFFIKGANIALKTAQKYGCKIALLKAKSPSCGSGKIYDGSFSQVLVNGDGITSLLLKQNGIKVFCETEIDELSEYVEKISKEV